MTAFEAGTLSRDDPCASACMVIDAPAPTQSTNIKGNRLILAALDAGQTMEVYALPDHGLLYYGGFHINLAAGLEDSLVATLKPAWNKMGI